MLAACSGGGGGNDAGPDVLGGPDSSSDVGVATDADADVFVAPVLDACVPVEGGAACDPAHVPCGTSSCTAGSQFCCIQSDAGSFTCDPTSMPTQCQMMMTAGTTEYCDEAANCPDAELCCGYVGGGGGYSTSCQASCQGTAIQFCHGNAECGSNGPCVVQHCRGVLVETCGGLLECPP